MRQQFLLAILTGATISVAQDRCGSFTIKPEVADLDVRITSMSVLTTDDSQISKDTKFELDKTSEMLYSNNALCSFQRKQSGKQTLTSPSLPIETSCRLKTH